MLLQTNLKEAYGNSDGGGGGGGGNASFFLFLIYKNKKIIDVGFIHEFDFTSCCVRGVCGSVLLGARPFQSVSCE